MKRLIVALFVLSLLAVAVPAKAVMADGTVTEECVTVTQYGGASKVVCTKHEPKDTGLADINPVVLASGFFAMAGYTLAKYKKLVRSEVGL